MKLVAHSEAAKAALPGITRKGELRATKPKDGNDAYIWRMVGFAISPDPRLQCMPVTADFGVEVPQDWHQEMPVSWLAEACERTRQRAEDVAYCVREHGSVEAYHLSRWPTYERRRQFIKRVLDPIVKELVDNVPLRRQAGTMRWTRAFGVV